MAVKMEKASKVYTCCGKYYAMTKEFESKKPKCENCGKTLKSPIKTPVIMVSTSNE